MDIQTELKLFADYYVPEQSQDIHEALELDSLNQINLEKLLAINGLAKDYVFRLKDAWGAWSARAAMEDRNNGNAAISQAEITSKPIRVSQNTLCFLLDIRSETLRQTIKKDPDFPKPIKKGIHEQGAVHYDYQEILNWHESKKSKAYKKAQEDAELNAIADSRKDQKRISVNIEDL